MNPHLLSFILEKFNSHGIFHRPYSMEMMRIQMPIYVLWSHGSRSSNCNACNCWLLEGRLVDPMSNLDCINKGSENLECSISSLPPNIMHIYFLVCSADSNTSTTAAAKTKRISLINHGPRTTFTPAEASRVWGFKKRGVFSLPSFFKILFCYEEAGLIKCPPIQGSRFLYLCNLDCSSGRQVDPRAISKSDLSMSDCW